MKFPDPPQLPNWVMRRFPLKPGQPPGRYWLTSFDNALLVGLVLAGVLAIFGSGLWGFFGGVAAGVCAAVALMRAFMAMVNNQRVQNWQFEPLDQDETPPDERWT